MRPFGMLGCGSERSVQVSPRSVERKRWSPFTKAHTTPFPEAASCAEVGRGIGVALVDGRVDGVAAPVGNALVVLGDGEGDADGDADGAHAETRTIRTQSALTGSDLELEALACDDDLETLAPAGALRLEADVVERVVGPVGVVVVQHEPLHVRLCCDVDRRVDRRMAP